jgi:threonyl-tRNA synthetase
VTDAHVPYLAAFADRLRAQDVRVDIDSSDDRMQKKIRTWTKQKVPFLLIAGDEDVAGGTVSFRYRDGSQRNGVPLDRAVEEVVATIRSRVNAGPSAALFAEADNRRSDGGSAERADGGAAGEGTTPA